jgi:hypothetical protein
MPAVTHEVVSYKVELRRMRTSTVGVVWLSSAERMVAAIAFVDGTGPLPPLHHGPTGVVSWTLRAHSLPVMVDMLRNEKPVFFTWWKEKGFASVTTAAEPVGEGELPPLRARARKLSAPRRSRKGRAKAP